MSGYSKTPLFKKLGIKDHFNLKLVDAPKSFNDYLNKIDLEFTQDEHKPKDIIILFTNKIDILEQGLLDLQMEIKQNGMIWVAWYKKSSKKQTEVNENIIRTTALRLKLVDVKVCSIDKDWSGLKMVIPLKHRKA